MKRALRILLTGLLLAAFALGALAQEAENPWVDCGMDMAKAAEAAGFEFAIPALSNYEVRVIPEKIIEVRYPRDDDTIVLRKSPMEPDEGDISGDQTEYSKNVSTDVNGVEVQLRGEGDVIYVASFVAFDGSYSVSCSAGMTEDEVKQILTEVWQANAK